MCPQHWRFRSVSATSRSTISALPSRALRATGAPGPADRPASSPPRASPRRDRTRAHVPRAQVLREPQRDLRSHPDGRVEEATEALHQAEVRLIAERVRLRVHLDAQPAAQDREQPSVRLDAGHTGACLHAEITAWETPSSDASLRWLSPELRRIVRTSFAETSVDEHRDAGASIGSSFVDRHGHKDASSSLGPDHARLRSAPARRRFPRWSTPRTRRATDRPARPLPALVHRAHQAGDGPPGPPSLPPLVHPARRRATAAARRPFPLVHPARRRATDRPGRPPLRPLVHPARQAGDGPERAGTPSRVDQRPRAVVCYTPCSPTTRGARLRAPDAPATAGIPRSP